MKDGMLMGLYPQLYVKKKDELFPLINKYSEKKITLETPHKEVIPIYYDLLVSNAAFRGEADKLVEGNKRKLLTVRDRIMAKREEQEAKKSENRTRERLTGERKGKPLSETGEAKSRSRLPYYETGEANNKRRGEAFFENAADPVTAIADAIGSVFGVIGQAQEKKMMEDQAFYEVILRQEKENETVKVLVMSGIAIAFIIVGLIVVKKVK